MKKKTIDILIPTYKRADSLKKNLDSLVKQIKRNTLQHYINIIVSNNNSPDNTEEICMEFSENYPKLIYYYLQKENMGLEKNAVFVLSKSISDYVMFLGDDDYLPIGYLRDVKIILDNDTNCSCILPSKVSFSLKGEIGKSVYRNYDVKKYSPSLQTLLKLGSMGHSMSGHIFKREGLLKKYLEVDEYRNIYLFLFFVNYNILRGNSYFYPKHKLKITYENAKDWNYPKDNYLSEISKNYKILFPNEPLKRYLSIINLFSKQDWRFYFNYIPIKSVRILNSILMNKKIDTFIKLSLPFLFLFLYIRFIYRMIKKNIKKLFN